MCILASLLAVIEQLPRGGANPHRQHEKFEVNGEAYVMMVHISVASVALVASGNDYKSIDYE